MAFQAAPTTAVNTANQNMAQPVSSFNAPEDVPATIPWQAAPLPNVVFAQGVVGYPIS